MLLSVRDLRVHFPVRRGVLGRVADHVRAVDSVSFDISPGETLGLVGESGCGKTTVGRAILRLVPATSGSVRFEGEQVLDLGRARLRQLRRQMQIIFQDPAGSLNPRLTVGEIVGEPLLVHGLARGAELKSRVEQLLVRCGLWKEAASRYPHQFSGGQRQRIGIARALSANPRLIVADEPVSALDVSVQAQVLNLMMDLQDELGLTYLFVSHDLSVVNQISNRVIVMYVGRIAEIGPPQELFARPIHPYTAALISSLPKADPFARRERIIPEGEVANPANPPTGCYFHPRCPFVIDICKHETPPLEEIVPGRFASCHRARELDLHV
jgi:peptide/nickel transport system ATP-binding protein